MTGAASQLHLRGRRFFERCKKQIYAADFTHVNITDNAPESRLMATVTIHPGTLKEQPNPRLLQRPSPGRPGEIAHHCSIRAGGHAGIAGRLLPQRESEIPPPPAVETFRTLLNDVLQRQHSPG